MSVQASSQSNIGSFTLGELQDVATVVECEIKLAVETRVKKFTISVFRAT